MTSPRSEHAEALRSSVERLCQLAAAEDLEKLGVERRKLEQALASLTVEADGLRAERDAARRPPTSTWRSEARRAASAAVRAACSLFSI